LLREIRMSRRGLVERFEEGVGGGRWSLLLSGGGVNGRGREREGYVVMGAGTEEGSKGRRGETRELLPKG